jgi:flagellar assembly factor FliW
MRIDTSRFGTIQVEDEDTYDVPHGIPGFAALRRAAVLAVDPSGDQNSLYWLQDLDDPELAFLCVVPWSAFPAYDLEVDERTLGIVDPEDVRVLSLVTVRRNGDVHPIAERRAATMTVNLRAPLIIDVRRRQLQQVILADARWSVHEPLVHAAEVAG